MRTIFAFQFFLSLLISTLLISSGAFAITLTDPDTGLSLNAPKGLKLSRNGDVYVLKGKNAKATFVLARSPLSVSATADSFIKTAKVKQARKSKHGSSYSVSGRIGSKNIAAHFKPSGSVIVFSLVKGNISTRQASIRQTSNRRKASAVTLGDIAILQRVIDTARGGRTVPLNLTVPMRQFVAPDGGSSALVPDLPGWSYSGGGGVVTGLNVNQGTFSLGVPVIVSLPGFFGNPPISNFVLPDQAIATVWPQYVATYYGAQVQVLSVQKIQGTDGWLGANFLSAMYAVRFAFNGRNWQALMVSGCFDTGSSIGWGWYYSQIAVPEGGPGGIAPALLDTWATWDNSVASQARLNQALRTLLSIRVNGYPIDPVVFDKAANDWSEYIRQ